MTDTKLSDELHAALSKPRPTARAAATIHANYWASRVADLEKRLQQAERERDELRNQRDDMKRELALRDTTEAMLGQQSAELRARRAVDEWLVATGTNHIELADALGLEWRE